MNTTICTAQNPLDTEALPARDLPPERPAPEGSRQSQRIIDTARRVCDRVTAFFAAAAAAYALDSATPARADAVPAPPQAAPVVAAARAMDQEIVLKQKQEWIFSLGDSTSVATRVARRHKMFLGSVDSHGRAGIGFGRTFKLLPTFDGHRTCLTPTAVAYGQSGHASRLDLFMHSEWFTSEPKTVAARHSTLFDTQAGLILQKGHPATVRVSQGFTTYDREAKGIRPREQGMRIITEYSPEGLEQRYSAQQQGGMTRVRIQKFNLEQWAFFNWRLGPGLVQVNIGATRKRTENRSSEAEASDSTNFRHRRRPQGGSVVRPAFLWRLQFILRR